MKINTSIFKDELIANIFHFNRIHAICNIYNYNFKDYVHYILYIEI